MKKINLLLLAVLMSSQLLFTSCGDDKEPEDEKEETPSLTVAETYDADFNTTPTKTAEASKSQKDLITKLGANRPSKGTVSEITKSALEADYSVGTPSAMSIASAAFKTTLNDLFQVYQTNTAAAANGNIIDWDSLGKTPNGGNGPSHVFSRNAVEIEQLIVKGSFGGVSFNHVKNTLFAVPSAVTQADLDAALNLYGSNPDFSETDLSAKYTKSRKKDGKTYHELINYEFRRAQAAIKQNIEAEKVAAVNQILLLWEEGLAAQVIYYTNDVFNYFNAGAAEITDKGSSGCHAWSESVGILIGFYGVPGTKITDTQLESILNKLNTTAVGHDGKPMEMYGNAAKLADLNTAIDEVAAIYGLTASEHKR